MSRKQSFQVMEKGILATRLIALLLIETYPTITAASILFIIQTWNYKRNDFGRERAICLNSKISELKQLNVAGITFYFNFYR